MNTSSPERPDSSAATSSSGCCSARGRSTRWSGPARGAGWRSCGPAGEPTGRGSCPIAGDLSQPGLGRLRGGPGDAARRRRPLLPPGGDLRHDRRRRGPGGRQRRGHPARGRAGRRDRGRLLPPDQLDRRRRASTGASGARTCSRRPRSSTPTPTSAPSTSPSGSCARSAAGPGGSTGPGSSSATRGPGRSTRSTAPTTSSSCCSGRGGCCLPGCRRVGRRGRRDQHRPGRLRRRRDRPHRPPARARRPGLPPHRPAPEDAPARRSTSSPRPPTRRRWRCGSMPDVTEPATTLVAHRPEAASRRRSGRRRWRWASFGIPPGVLTYVNYPTSFDSTRRPGGAGGLGDRGAAAGDLRGPLWDYWERNLDPDLFKDRSLSGGGAGQGGADHRRLLGDRQGDRGQGRRRRRDGAAGGALGREAGGDEGARSRRPGASPTSTAATCPTSRTSSGWPRRCSPTTARSTSSSTTPGARSGARSALSYDRFHDYERTIQLNYFGAVRLILALLPSMRARKSGHIINISSIGTQTNPPRFSAYVASKAALDAFSRVIASEVDRRRRPHHDDPHAAGADADDRADADVRHVPGDHARGGGGDDRRGDGRTSRRRWRRGWGTSASCSTRWRPKASDTILNTAYKLFPESQAAKGKGEEAPDKAPTTEAVAFAHLMKGVHW